MDHHLLTFFKLSLKDLRGSPKHKELPLNCLDKDQCLQYAVAWLEQAHYQGGNSGVSYGYSLKGGWRAPYRETTGYIAVTFFALADFLSDNNYKSQALAMCEWLLTIQNKDGSISNPKVNRESGIVFDTGQVLFGLVKAYEETGDYRFLDGAKKAANWLYDSATDPQLRWTKHTYNGVPHVYNARVAWAVLRLNQIDTNEKWVNLARANLDFAVENHTNGWFDQCAFDLRSAPFTHTIAYAIRGLFESACLLNDKRYLETAESVATSLIKKTTATGFIPGQIAIDGSSDDSYCCLTGNCQLAIAWAKMYKLTHQPLYKDSALLALQYVMGHQVNDLKNRNIHGAIKGSHPIWGKYSAFTFPNWATKFYVDALMECWDWL